MLFRFRVPILVGLGVLLVAAIALVVVLPRQFQSRFDILVRNKLPLSTRLSAASEETVDQERMQSELALLHSPELAAKAVDPDYPTQPDATHTAADISRHQAAIALFSQQLVTTVAPNSNLIHVAVTASDPHRAGELASRLLDVFFASQPEVAHPTPATAFFIAESDHARDAWQQAQLALDTFRLAHPPTPVGSAAEISLQIAALSHQIQRNDEQIDASIGRILTGERKLITIPAHPLDPAGGAPGKPRSATMPLLSPAQLTDMLSIYTDEQAILLTRPPTDADAVRASLSLASQISDTDAALRLARQVTAPERDPAASSLWQTTTADIAQASAELKSLYATRISLASQLTAFQANLDAIQRPPATIASLQVKASSLQATYRLAEQRANEARIADAMDQQLRLNVAVASPPSFSNTATSPSPWLYAAAIALAVIFLAACLTLFAGVHSNGYDAHAEDEEDYDEEDSSEAHYQPRYNDEYGRNFVADPQEEETQQQIPFPSRIRPAASGAFLYAAPGSSVPNPHPAVDADASLFPDRLFDPLHQAPPLSEILSQPAPRSGSRDAFRPAFEAALETRKTENQKTEPQEIEPQETEPNHPTPSAEIFNPNHYQSAPPPADSSAEPEEEFEARPTFTRPAPGEPHTVVPSFFAAPPTGSVVLDKDYEPEHGSKTSYAPYSEPSAPTPVVAAPVVAAPFGGAPLVEASAIPTPEPEPIVTLPDPTPPWSQPTAEPKPSSLPPLTYWASIHDTPAAPLEAASEAPIVAPEHFPEPTHVEPAEPVAVEPVHVVPPIPVADETHTPPAPRPVAVHPAAVEPKALPQTFTSTVRPDPFLSSVTSTLSAPAFHFNSPSVRPPAPAPKTAPAPPQPAPAVEPRRPIEPPPFTPDPELVVHYASDPIELVPDPVLPPIKLPYKVPQRETPQDEPSPQPAQRQAAQASETESDLADFPLYRAPKRTTDIPTPHIEPRPVPSPIPDSATVHSPSRPQTYEEMVRALVFPEEFAPYVPPSRPTPARPPAPEFIPEPRPVVPPAPPIASRPAPDDEAPPFNYVRKSVPPEPPFTAPPRQENPETIQSFIRRPSVPLQPAPGRYDDRTTYRPAEPPQRDDRTTYQPAAFAPPQPAPPTPQPPSSWIDIAPPPAPRAESLDPQNRPPDRISAIRDSGPRSFPVTDRSGIRLTPSQRMKLGRPTTNVDKDGNVTYTDYLKDQDKPRR